MNSLPFLLRLGAAALTAQQNRLLLAEVAYLRTELAYPREQLPEGHRHRFTDAWRMRFARAGATVGWHRLAEIATVAKARTIQGWDRLRRAGILGAQRPGRGRPRSQAAIERVIRRLAKENPLWGQKRIAAVLAMCLLSISPRTIAAILKRSGYEPAPQRGSDWSWKRFVTEKADDVTTENRSS